MHIYHNDFYNAPQFNFETTKKSKYLAEVLKSAGYGVNDPSEMLLIANSLIKSHTHKDYLASLKNGTDRKLAQTNGFDWDFGIYEMVANSTAGILSAIDDLQRGADSSCSLSSGLHHATPDKGKGFCTINSLALGAIYASLVHKKRVTILDLDAHCGGGTYQFIKQQRERGNNLIRQVDVCIEPFDSYVTTDSMDILHIFDDWQHVHDEQYLLTVNEIIKNNISSENTDIVLYNAGVDIYPQLTETAVHMRDLYVSKFLKGIPTVVLMAGGYGAMNKIVDLHLNTISIFARRNLSHTNIWELLAN